jgi:hypothetical protein
MNILEALMAAQGGGAARQLGQQFGLSDDQTSAALSSLVPALAAGLAKNATREGGLEGLTAALAGGRHGGYLDDLGSLTRTETVADGNGILGHILGTKDMSRQVAAQAAASSGVGSDVLKRMLPVVAAMVMGAMAKNAGGRAATAGCLLEMLTPMLDRDRDGSVVDDVTGMLGKLLGGR